MGKLNGLILAAAFAFAAAAPTPGLAADKSEAPAGAVKVVGYLVKIDMAKDGKSAVATLLVKGKKIAILVKDELTLKKFKVGKIKTDDEIKCAYKPGSEGNLSVSFLRTAGC